MGLRFSSNIQSHESVNWLTLAAPTEVLVLYRIAQDYPTGWHHISLRSLTTKLKEPNQRCTTDANHLEMRERSEGWSHASRAARIEGRTAGRSPRNDPDTYATAGGPARQVLTGVRGNPVRRPDVPGARRHHHGGGNR